MNKPSPAEPVAIAEARFARGEISRQRLYQIRRRADGLCMMCGTAPIAAAGLCAEHVAEARARQNDRYQRMHPGAQPLRCPRCGGSGHNRRTCDAHMYPY